MQLCRGKAWNSWSRTVISGRQMVDIYGVVPNRSDSRFTLTHPWCCEQPTVLMLPCKYSCSQSSCWLARRVSTFFVGDCSPCVHSLFTWHHCTWPNLIGLPLSVYCKQSKSGGENILEKGYSYPSHLLQPTFTPTIHNPPPLTPFTISHLSRPTSTHTLIHTHNNTAYRRVEDLFLGENAFLVDLDYFGSLPPLKPAGYGSPSPANPFRTTSVMATSSYQQTQFNANKPRPPTLNQLASAITGNFVMCNAQELFWDDIH